MLQEAMPTFARLRNLILKPMLPFQYVLDTPGVTHEHCLDQAYATLVHDGKEEVFRFFKPYHKRIIKGVYWADRGWKNVTHYYSNPEKPNSLSWPGAASVTQTYYNQALQNYTADIHKSMFYLGAALHIIQDMCVPHHSVGTLFDGHKEFEKWATKNWQSFSVDKDGLYLDFSHASQWVDYNALLSEPYYPLTSLQNGCNARSFAEAASVLIPLTIRSSAGFLDFVHKKLQTGPLG